MMVAQVIWLVSVLVLRKEETLVLLGKAPQIISSSSSGDDVDDRVNRGGRNIGEGNEDSEDTNGNNGASSGIGASGAVDGGYVNQVDHDMSWAQGDGNYYATQWSRIWILS